MKMEFENVLLSNPLFKKSFRDWKTNSSEYFFLFAKLLNLPVCFPDSLARHSVRKLIDIKIRKRLDADYKDRTKPVISVVQINRAFFLDARAAVEGAKANLNISHVVFPSASRLPGVRI